MLRISNTKPESMKAGRKVTIIAIWPATNWFLATVEMSRQIPSVLHGGVGQRVGTKARPHLFGGPFGEDPALRRYHQPLTIFGFLHEVRRNHDRDRALRQRIDAPPEISPPKRINARGRLVEEQDVGFVHQGDRERQALLESQREVAAGGIRERAQLEFSECPLDTLALMRAFESIGGAEEAQVLDHR